MRNYATFAKIAEDTTRKIEEKPAQDKSDKSKEDSNAAKNKPTPDWLDTSAGLDYGNMYPVSMTVGRVVASPLALALPRLLRDPYDSSKINTVASGISDKDTRAQVHKEIYDRMRRVNPDELSTVRISLGGDDPVTSVLRVLRNKRLSLLTKAIGVPIAAAASLGLSSQRANAYNPFTDTIDLHSDNPAILTHELGHAIDINAKTPKYALNDKPGIINAIKRQFGALPRDSYVLTSALADFLPVVGPLLKNIYMEGAANTHSLANVSKAFKDNPKALKHLKRMRTRSLFPAYSTYITGTAKPYLPAPLQAIPYLGVGVATAASAPSRLAAGESFNTSLSSFREAIGLDAKDSVTLDREKIKEESKEYRRKLEARRKRAKERAHTPGVKIASSLSDNDPIASALAPYAPTLDPKYKDFRYTPFTSLGTGALFALVANIRSRRRKESFLKRLGNTLNWGIAGTTLGYLGGQGLDLWSRRRGLNKLVKDFKPGKDETNEEAVNELANRYGWIWAPRWWDLRLPEGRDAHIVAPDTSKGGRFNWSSTELSGAERDRHVHEIAQRGVDDLRYENFLKDIKKRYGEDIDKGLDKLPAYEDYNNFGPGANHYKARLRDALIHELPLQDNQDLRSAANAKADLLGPEDSDSANAFINNERNR